MSITSITFVKLFVNRLVKLASRNLKLKYGTIIFNDMSKSEFDSNQLTQHIVPDLPEDQLYTVKPGQLPHTVIFCPECQKSFFDKPIETWKDIFSFTAAQQIAQHHADSLHHTVCQSDPERLM